MWSSAHAKMSKNLDANVTQKPEKEPLLPLFCNPSRVVNTCFQRQLESMK